LRIASGRAQTLTAIFVDVTLETHSKSVRANATRYVDIGGVSSKRDNRRPSDC